MPRQAWALAAGLLAFTVVIIGVLLWAALSGQAGTQRGFVVTTAIPREIVVTLEDGREAQLGEVRREATFVVKRDEFPMTIHVTDEEDGALLVEDTVTYEELVRADFRMSVDTNGFFPTSEYRDTPEATP